MQSYIIERNTSTFDCQLKVKLNLMCIILTLLCSVSFARLIAPVVQLSLGTGIRGLMRGMATLPKVTRSY